MRQYNLSLGFTVGCFSLFMLVAYFGLVSYFEFPDILRQDTQYMLGVFQQNQNVIIPFYYLFALSQVVFVIIILQLKHYFRGTPSMLLSVASGIGVLAGLCQAIGFLRWPFLVPYLASVISDPATSVASKEAATVVFQSFHQFAGVAVGENLFFVFEAIWGICFGAYLLKYQLISRQLASIPVIAGIAILIYSLEQFGGSMAILAPLNVIAHAALVFWFIALSKIFLPLHSIINSKIKVGRVTTILLWVIYLLIVSPGLIPAQA